MTQPASPTKEHAVTPPPLLTVDRLQTHFHLDDGTVRAVDEVSFTIPRGKTLCIVGESGCGKSVTAFSMLRLVSRPGRIVGGRIVLHQPDGEDVDISKLPDEGKAIRAIRGRDIAMIFQEPMTSLSPVHNVGSQIAEAVRLHEPVTKHEASRRAITMMGRVGIPDPEQRYKQYPHEMSGGLRQRAMVAMALSCRPKLLIADEPTTALDVTIQAEILSLMRELQQEMDMAILLITHDLGVVAQMADEVAVMYLGRVVEQAPVLKLFDAPQHPYTQGLLDSIPGRAARKSMLKSIRGSVPDPFTRLTGCPYHPRCDLAEAGLCNVGERPPLREVAPGHRSACLVRQREAGVDIQSQSAQTTAEASTP